MRLGTGSVPGGWGRSLVDHPIVLVAVVLADVLVLQLWVLGDELLHQPNAVGVVEHQHLAAVLGRPVVAAGEGAGLADEHSRDAELAHQPAAVPVGERVVTIVVPR